MPPLSTIIVMIFKQYKSYQTCFSCVNDGRSQKTAVIISVHSSHYQNLNPLLEALCELLGKKKVNKVSV